MKIPFLDLKRKYEMLEPDLKDLVAEVMSEQRFVGGKRIEHFEGRFAGVHRVKHCIGTGNATDALFIILKALGIGAGDEVIVPAHGWMSAAEMVLLAGAKPVFADVDIESYCIDPQKAEEKITERTKAIIPIHLYGQMANMNELKLMAERHGIFLIEDAAQAHCASQNGQMAGSLGTAAAFSFYPSKLLGAYGDGGCITTQDDELAAKCRAMANHGGVEKNEHQFAGLNSRLDTLQAAILDFKLDHVDDWITGRNHVAGTYSEGFEDLAEVSAPRICMGNGHNFHLYVIRAQRRDQLKDYLASVGIETEIHYPVATPFTPAFTHLGHKPKDFPVSAQLQTELLSLPIFATITYEEVAYIIDRVKEFYRLR